MFRFSCTRYSPVGIFFLVVERTHEISELSVAGNAIRGYVITALSGLVLYGMVFLPFAYAVVVRRDVRPFLRIMTSPVIKAFKSASRAVSVPVTIRKSTHLFSALLFHAFV